MNEKSLVLSIMFVVKFTNHMKFYKLTSSNYNTKIVHSTRAMESVININTPDLVIVDNDLIKTVLDQSIIKSSAMDRAIPIILLVNNQAEAVDALSLGVSDFFIKPIVPELIMNRIKIHMKTVADLKFYTNMNIHMHDKLKEKSEELNKLQSDVIIVLTDAIEFRDFDTETRSIRTQGYMKLLIQRLLEIPNIYRKEIMLWDIQDHILASQLHDIGKIGIPDNLLMKKEPLTAEEFSAIKEHVIIGERIIDKILKRTGDNTYLRIARKYVSDHHEYWDGNGYPRRLSGCDISLEGRLMAVVDVYDAITSARPYKGIKSHMTAMEIINSESGTQFDPEIVRIFNTMAPTLENMFKDNKDGVY